MRGFFIRLVGNKKIKKRDEKIDIKDIKSFYIDGIKIGDFIVVTPLLKELKRQMPWIKITVSLHSSVLPLIENCPFVDESVVHIYKKKKQIKILRIFNELLEAYKIRGKYDLYFERDKKANFIHILGHRIKGIKYLYSVEKFEKYGVKATELSIYRGYIERGEKEHLSDVMLKFLDFFGLDKGDGKYQLNLGENEEKYKEYFPKEKFNIIFNFNASIPARTMTIEETIEILKKLEGKGSEIRTHVLTLPENYEMLKEILEKNKMENVVLLPVLESIAEVAGIVKYTDMVLSVDTSIVHIASTYNVPLVGIYIAKDESGLNLFAPRSEEYKIVLRDKKVNVDEVIEATMSLMEDIKNKK